MFNFLKDAAVGRSLICLALMALPLRGDPVSSANYGEALSMAERIVSQAPEWRIYRCEGSSMGDYYGGNSLLLVEKARLEDVRTGMMIVYRKRDGSLIAHKVVQHHGSWLRTQGVMNERPDPVYVRAEMVVGTVFGVLHTKGLPRGRLATSDGRLVPTALCRSY